MKGRVSRKLGRGQSSTGGKPYKGEKNNISIFYPKYIRRV